MTPDPRPLGRIRDGELLARLHRRRGTCALCPKRWESLHHISKHPRDDVEANLVMLCGHGTAGCHGLVEAHDAATMKLLSAHIRRKRPDFVRYLTNRFKGERRMTEREAFAAALAWVDALAESKLGRGAA